MQRFSPRTRRCFRIEVLPRKPRPVFSAYAEVFLLHRPFALGYQGFLRVRGGVSPPRYDRDRVFQFSPRTRRCFRNFKKFAGEFCVFSAYAEVFPNRPVPVVVVVGFLRVRGGVSAMFMVILFLGQFSPRTRRCFCNMGLEIEKALVFSAYAEVFLLAFIFAMWTVCFLRVRGGVSIFVVWCFSLTSFSPRTRRCFLE